MVFILIFIIYLFISSKWCQQEQRKSPPVFIYLCKLLVVAHGFRFNIHDIFIYLFKMMWTKASGTDHLFLFIYANCLLIICGFRFNIHYLFVCLFKLTSIETAGTDHLFLFTYGNHLLSHMVFVLIFTIYFFIYWNSCQQKQVEPTTSFYLLVCQSHRFPL